LQAVEKRFPDTKVHVIMTPFQREAFFNSPDLGDQKGGIAPFFNTLLGSWPRRQAERRNAAAEYFFDPRPAALHSNRLTKRRRFPALARDDKGWLAN